MKHRVRKLRVRVLCLAISGLVLVAVPVAWAHSLADASTASQESMELGKVWAVRVHYESREDVQRLSRVIDHMQIDEARQTILLEISSVTIETLRGMGFKVEVDSEKSLALQKFLDQRKEHLLQQKKGGPSGMQTLEKSSLAKTAEEQFNGNAACYRTVEQSNLDIDALAQHYPDLIQVAPVGQTWVQKQALSFRNLLIKYLPASVLSLIDFDLLPDSSGNGLRAVVIGNRAVIKDKKVPRMVTTSSIHAREYTPAELSTRFAEWLVKGYGSNPTATWLLNNNEFHFILHANPDGRKMAEQAVPQAGGSGWRKNVNLVEGYCKLTPTQEALIASRPSYASFYGPVNSGVDLNRNFPFGWNSTGGEGSSGDPCDGTYRGSFGASEPETQAIVKYVAGTLGSDGNYVGGILADRRTAAPDDFATGAPDDYEGLFMDIHSFSQLVLWPWGIRRDSLGGNSQTANEEGMAAFGQRMAWYNGYRATQMINYDTDGTTTDTFYGELGAPSFTIELGTSFYEPCDSFEQNTFPKNVASLQYAARTVKAPYQLPLGPDAVDLKLSAATVRQGTLVTLTATIDDDRYLYDQGFAGNQPPVKNDPQPIKAASAYVNLLPWDDGAKPIALTPVEGSAFGSGPKLDVSGVIDTSKFAPGRHLIYVQGTNARDKSGPPDAVFLEVLAKDAPDPCPPTQTL